MGTIGILASSIVERVKDIPFSRMDDELLAIDAQAGYCYSLSPTAGRVWELIRSPMPVGAVCRQLREEYRVDETTCEREVIALLRRLHEAGLVRVNDAVSN